jgi:FKBP-type peptidyl-prolyl cis-trans isomerase
VSLLFTGKISFIKSKNGENMKTASGLEYTEVEAGTGTQAAAGKTVSVHYTGKFQDGKVFDSSIPRGEALTFRLGVGQVIKGWDEGIALMKVGGKAQLTIPPELAYGERGASGVIPPNATLVFDVELVAVK